MFGALTTYREALKSNMRDNERMMAETVSFQIGMSMLEARRREKDFLMRRDMKSQQIASAVAEQRQAIGEVAETTSSVASTASLISRNVEEASTAVNEVEKNGEQLAVAVNEIARTAGSVSGGAETVASQSEQMRDGVESTAGSASSWLAVLADSPATISAVMRECRRPAGSQRPERHKVLWPVPR